MESRNGLGRPPDGPEDCGPPPPAGAVGKRLYPTVSPRAGVPPEGPPGGTADIRPQQIGISSPSHFIAQHNNNSILFLGACRGKAGGKKLLQGQYNSHRHQKSDKRPGKDLIPILCVLGAEITQGNLHGVHVLRSRHQNGPKERFPLVHKEHQPRTDAYRLGVGAGQ